MGGSEVKDLGRKKKLPSNQQVSETREKSDKKPQGERKKPGKHNKIKGGGEGESKKWL